MASKSRCNRVTKAFKIAKSKYNIKTIEESGDNSTTFWRTIKKIMPGEPKTVSSNFKIAGRLIADNKTIAGSFNNFFLGNVGRLIETMNEVAMSLVGLTCARSTAVILRTTSTFKFEEISEQVIYTRLLKLKTSKAAGLDQMPSRL